MNMKINQVANFLITGNIQVLLIFTVWFTPSENELCVLTGFGVGSISLLNCLILFIYLFSSARQIIRT